MGVCGAWSLHINAWKREWNGHMREIKSMSILEQ